ncbi:MAG: hypothetical protein ABIO46_09335 [Chitinophagales bacterium]
MQILLISISFWYPEKINRSQMNSLMGILLLQAMSKLVRTAEFISAYAKFSGDSETRPG